MIRVAPSSPHIHTRSKRRVPLRVRARIGEIVHPGSQLLDRLLLAPPSSPPSEVAVVDTSPRLDRAELPVRGDDHPTRSAILDLLKEGEQCAGEIARRLDVSRPTLSHHMATLSERGLVLWRQQGAFRFYSLVGSATPVAGPTKTAKQVPVETPFALAFKRLAEERGIEVRGPSSRSRKVRGGAFPHSGGLDDDV